MDCRNCKVKCKWDHELCNNCGFDDKVTISLTNVKKTFKLTEKELDNSNIYSFTYRTTYGPGTRYLWKEVSELADKLTVGDERRRKYYDKYMTLQKKIKNDREELDDLREKCRIMVTGLLLRESIDMDNLDGVLEKKLRLRIKYYIEKYVILGSRLSDVASVIVRKIRNYYDDIVEKCKRQNEVDKILKKYDEMYHGMIKSNKFIIKYIEDGDEFDIKQIISDKVKQKKRKVAREKKISEFVDTFPENYREYGRSTAEYTNYINDVIDLKTAKKSITELINNKETQDKVEHEKKRDRANRLAYLNRHLKKKYTDNIDLYRAKNSKYATKFIDGRIDKEDVLDLIDKELTETKLSKTKQKKLSKIVYKVMPQPNVKPQPPVNKFELQINELIGSDCKCVIEDYISTKNINIPTTETEINDFINNLKLVKDDLENYKELTDDEKVWLKKMPHNHIMINKYSKLFLDTKLTKICNKSLDSLNITVNNSELGYMRRRCNQLNVNYTENRVDKQTVLFKI